MYTISFQLERKHEFARKTKDYFLVPIRSIEKSHYDGKVHNLQINDWTNSYLVKGFVVHNCGAAIATSSMVTDLVKGKTIGEALKVSNHAVAEALGGLPKIKMHCSVLAEQALRSAIDDYLAKKRKNKDREGEIGEEKGKE
ncbi:MAG: iron-sulfur cluster assembly scaffold protein [Candidatus Omnitrophota bacterium]|nr:iron-sulfur cluster assembly scaffold protein [Candidatus Omnitrophota bacterium]